MNTAPELCVSFLDVCAVISPIFLPDGWVANAAYVCGEYFGLNITNSLTFFKDRMEVSK